MHKSVLCLMGPTASGKTALALHLAQRFPIEIISVDSALVYRGMDIGTAKPSLSEQTAVVHHLLDVVDPNEAYTVARFCKEATLAIEAVRQRNAIPLLVGGSMMYFNALQYGLSSLPEADTHVRAKLTAELQQQGLNALYERLLEHDPISAARLKPQDSQRILRALEVYHLTGKPISVLQKKTVNNDYTFVNILLIPDDRAWLHKKIAERFETMLEQGFLQEIASLVERWPHASTYAAFKMVGYRQALEYSDHQDLQKFKDNTLAATRQLAKRQLTWLRHWPKGIVLNPQDHAIAATLEQRFRVYL